MKKILGIVIMMFIIAGIFSGCGDNKPIEAPLPSVNQENESPQIVNEVSETVTTNIDNSSTSMHFDKISDFIEAVTEMEGIHEEVINEYDGMPIIEIPVAFMPLVSASMYELLNIDDKDGRFEGKGMLSGYNEFIEKKGRVFNFGRDDVREKDGFTPNDKAGDRLVENGSFDGDKNLFHTEGHSERNGAIIQKTSMSCMLTKDNTLILLYQFGNNFNSKGEEYKANQAIFLTVGKEHYEFILAHNIVGANFKVLPFNITTIKEAQKIFEDNDFIIDTTGGIYDGKYEVTTY